MTTSGLTLLDPWLLASLVLVLGACVFRLVRRRAALPAASLASFEGVPVTLRQRLVALPGALLLLGGVLLCVALARPVEREVVPIREAGVDVLLAVDVSSSMRTKDMASGGEMMRVDAARSRAAAFARARATDRVGLLTYSAFAELTCPPTLDERALGAFIEAIQPMPEGSPLDGTATGTALAKAVRVLEKSEAKSKVVVLLTDGQTTVRDVDPLDAAKLAADSGIRVHTIGLGNGIPSPFGGWVAVDFTELEQVAKATGGRFFAAQSDADLAKVYEEIDRLEKAPIEDPRYRTVDRFELPLLAGLLALALSLLLELGWLRGAP